MRISKRATVFFIYTFACIYIYICVCVCVCVFSGFISARIGDLPTFDVERLIR